MMAEASTLQVHRQVWGLRGCASVPRCWADNYLSHPDLERAPAWKPAYPWRTRRHRSWPVDKDAASPVPARVLLADDHDILRQGLKLLLSQQPEEIEVIGEARTGREAVEMARTLQPDVVVMDITMPDMDGLEACRIIHQQQPATRVLMLTMHESEEYFLQ